MADGELARTQFNRSEILDIDGAIAGKPRPHEQSNVVAPRNERLLKIFYLLAAKRHEGCEGVRLGVAESEPSLHIDTAEQKSGVHAMMDVTGVDVGIARRARAGD